MKRAISIIFMLLVVAAVTFLLAAGPFDLPSHPCCSAKSCKTERMHP